MGHEADAKLVDLLRSGAANADLSGEDLRGQDFSGASLRAANLRGCLLSGATFTDSDLAEADLANTVLVGANLERASLSGSCVYGASVWDVRLDGSDQSNLIINPDGGARITVDGLELAQFVYLLLDNARVRKVIDTITSKVVLILGRFTPERKVVLEAMRSALRDTYGLVPILFDFEPSPKRDLTETVQLLANLSRFIVADVTDAKSIPQELSHIIPDLPSVPVQPIILAAQNEYSMFEHWRRFNNVLPEFPYPDLAYLLEKFKAGVIEPVKTWEQTVNRAAVNERLLREKIRTLQAENDRLKASRN